MESGIPNYEIKSLLHESRSSRIYRGFCLLDRVPVIIKTNRTEVPSMKEIHRFRREFSIGHEFQDPHIISYRALEPFHHGLAIILEDFGGIGLADILPANGFEPITALRIAIRLVDGLDCIHRNNRVHMSINPSNLVIHPETHEIKYIDFSMASRRHREDRQAMDSYRLEGNPVYMSPEQTGRMNRSVDYRTDFYSLGATLFELFSGRPPFGLGDPTTLIHRHMARQPDLLHDLNRNIPEAISLIVNKLLEKNPGNRYQGAHGLNIDLKRCLDDLELTGSVNLFDLGSSDSTDRFRLSTRFCGREAPLREILAAFERAHQGPAEMVLIKARSGMGKTTLIQEIQKPVIRSRGYLIGGKANSVTRHVPFSPILDACRELIRHVLTEPEQRVHQWRLGLEVALGENLALLREYIEELELLTGPIPPRPDPSFRHLETLEKTLLALFRLFADRDHPLVLQLPNLQWADKATFGFLLHLLRGEAFGHVLVLGAWSTDEESSEALDEFLEQTATLETRVRQLELQPLEQADLEALVSESLGIEPVMAAPLAAMVLQKTGGTPLFVRQFLESLYQDGLLRFQSELGSWTWDLHEIKTRSLTENVVSLLVNRLKKLPESTQFVVQIGAMIGNEFELRTLARVWGRSEGQVAVALWPAIRDEVLVSRGEDNLLLDELEVRPHTHSVPGTLNVTLRFQHSRIRQVACSLIPESRQKTLHLEIGRVFLKNLALEAVEEQLYTITTHLNQALELIGEPGEIIRLAALNLQAGRRAVEIHDPKSALPFFRIGVDLLPRDGWQNHYDLAWQLHSDLAECAFLLGQIEEADQVLELLVGKAGSVSEKAEILLTRALRFENTDRWNQACQAASEGLSLLGRAIPQQQPDRSREIQELEPRVLASLEQWDIGLFLQDAGTRMEIAPMEAQLLALLNRLLILTGDHQAWVLTTFRLMDLADQQRLGNIAAYACAAWARLARIQGRHQQATYFGNAVLLALKETSLGSFSVPALFLVAMDSGFRNESPLKLNLYLTEVFHRGLELATNNAWSGIALIYQMAFTLFLGQPLAKVQEYMQYIAFFPKERMPILHGTISLLFHRALALEDRANVQLQQLNQQDGHWHGAISGYPPFRLIDAYTSMTLFNLFEQPDQVIALYDRVGGLLPHSGEFLQTAIQFEAAMGLSEKGLSLPALERDPYIKQVQELKLGLMQGLEADEWTSESRCRLLQIQITRLQEKMPEAIGLFESTQHHARDFGNLQHQALAGELAARFWLGHQQHRIAAMFYRDARDDYGRWGAGSKVAELERKYGSIFLDSGFQTNAPKSENWQTLDLKAVLESAQAISSEINLEKALTLMMRVMMENAGAANGVLILKSPRGLIVRVAAQADGAAEGVLLTAPLEDYRNLPQTVVRFTVRTGDTVVLHHASREGLFTRDPYISSKASKSILCMPIFLKDRNIGALYLENNLSSHVFTEERIEVLRLLVTQAAISLEHAQLYDDLEDLVHQRTAQISKANRELQRQIQEREQAESALQTSEGKFRNILQVLPLGIIRYNLDQENRLICSESNPAAERILGVPCDLFVGRAIEEIFLTIEETQIPHHLVRIATEGGFWHSDELEYNDEIISGFFEVHAFQTAAREVAVMFSEVSKRKQAERELREAREAAEAATAAKSDFLANMSHEIRTPMNGILGLTDLALKTNSKERQREYLNIVRQSGISLLTIINDILDYSKIEAHKLKLETLPFRLSEVLDRVSDMFIKEVGEKALEIILTVGEVPEWLIGDPFRLGQVLINLSHNAIKFTERGEIMIRVRELGRNPERVELEFSVQDSGIGIDAAQLPKLFESFTQADGSTTRRFGGTGLGLSICRELVTMMGGEIRAETRPGEGSTFTFTVSLGYHKGQDTRTPKTPTVLQGLKVLLVDDNKTSRYIFERMLNNFSFRVTTAVSGEDALDILAGEVFDLAVVDWMMPGMDGIQLIKEMKANERTRPIPVIMMTAFGQEEIIYLAKRAGAAGFLTKPVKRALLLDTVMTVLGHEAQEKSQLKLVSNREVEASDSLNGSRVLVVEDNPINQEVAVGILRGAGVAVEIANNGQEALEILSKTSFDAVLMDVQMPEMDGFEATRLIRRHSKHKHLPIIAMTAHALPDDRDRCLAVGMNDYITKPIDAERLISTMAHFMGSKISQTHRAANLDWTPGQGIDLSHALQRLNGNHELLFKLLRQFSVDYRQTGPRVRALLEANSLEEAARLLHAIKGLAGNISAMQLYEQASRLEQAVLDGNTSPQDLIAYEIAFGDALTAAAAVTASQEVGTKPQAGPEAPIHMVEARRLVEELILLTRNHDLDAVHVMAELGNGLEGTGHDDKLHQLRHQLDYFDFNGATGTLENLIQDLQSGEKKT